MLYQLQKFAKYYQKIDRNGKKKRISKEEFMKHKKPAKKTNKKYKMKGGLNAELIEAIKAAHYLNSNEVNRITSDSAMKSIVDPYEYLKKIIEEKSIRWQSAILTKFQSIPSF